MKTRQLVFLLTALAMIATLIACADSSKTPPPPAVSIAALSGSGQSAFVGAAFTARLLATVTTGGSPTSGTMVTFTAPTSGPGGTFAGGVTTAMTDDRGVAASAVFTANATSGVYAVTAAVSGASTPASFNLTNTTAPVSVAFNPAPPAAMPTGATTILTAVVTDDSTNSGVTWSCTPANSCGSFSPATSAGSSATTTYTAPAAIPTAGSVTVTATAVKDSTQSAAATITITAQLPIFVSLQPVPPSIATDATTTLTAVVANDFTNSGVTWTCLPTNSCGSFNPATSTGSTATTTYTAPTAIPGGGSVIVTATSVKSASASASANIAITSSALANGTYVFSLTGEDQVGPAFFVAGAFQVTNGAITGGEQDFSNTITFGSDLINSAGSGVSTTADGNLQITLNTCNARDCSTTDSNVGVSGIETLNGTLVSASRALITEFDSSATASGSLDRQVATVSAAAQGYAFLATGLDTNFLFVSIGGVINVDGTASSGTVSISGTGSVFDINDGFSAIPNQSFAASSVTTPDSFGRVTFALNPSVASGISPISMVGYIVGPDRIQLVETGDTFRGSSGSMGGEALGQGNNTGKFNSASVLGSSFVFGITGSDTIGLLQAAGVLNANLDGTVSGTLNTNDLNGTGTQSPITFTGGSLTVDVTGRVTLTSLTSNGYNLQLYLSGSGTGTVISMDATDVLSGLAYQQTTVASFSGTYAMNASGFDSASKLEFDDVGPVSASLGTGTGSLIGTHTIDQNFMTPPATPAPGLSLSGALTPFASGVLTGTITGLDIDSQNANSDNFTYYIVDATKILAIETDAQQLTLVDFELQQ